MLTFKVSCKIKNIPFMQTSLTLIEPLGLIAKNDYIGEIALLSGSKRTASVITLEETKTLALSVEVLKEIINYSPSISFDIMRDNRPTFRTTTTL